MWLQIVYTYAMYLGIGNWPANPPDFGARNTD